MSISMLVDDEWVSLTSEEHAAHILADAAKDGIDLCPRCFGDIVAVDGMCKGCASDAVYNADPDYRAHGDALARLDFGAWAPDSDRPYTFDDAATDKATVARLEAKFARAERDADTDPGGCAMCGAPERGHAQRWHPHAGFEPWVAPSNAQRLARMYARRAQRLGLPVWSRPGKAGAA